MHTLVLEHGKLALWSFCASQALGMKTGTTSSMRSKPFGSTWRSLRLRPGEGGDSWDESRCGCSDYPKHQLEVEEEKKAADVIFARPRKPRGRSPSWAFPAWTAKSSLRFLRGCRCLLASPRRSSRVSAERGALFFSFIETRVWLVAKGNQGGHPPISLDFEDVAGGVLTFKLESF